MEPAVYRVKWIRYEGRQTPILLQSVNGPCPLIAVCNVLLLGNRISLTTGTATVSYPTLHALLQSYFSARAAEMSPSKVENYLRQVNDVLGNLESTQTGLNVNPIFSSCSAFEFTAELQLFDLCGVELVHTWVYDSDDEQLRSAISDMSYNQVTNIITAADYPDKERQQRLQRWLSETSNQQTLLGQSLVASHMGEGAMSILFAHNHFFVLLKRHSMVYELVTNADIAAADPRITWRSFGLARITHYDDVFQDLSHSEPDTPARPHTPGAYPGQQRYMHPGGANHGAAATMRRPSDDLCFCTIQ